MASPSQKQQKAVETAKNSNQRILFRNIDEIVRLTGLRYTTGISEAGQGDATGGLPVTQGEVDAASGDPNDLANFIGDYDFYAPVDPNDPNAARKIYNIDRYVAAFFGPPETVNAQLIHPPQSSEFLHAKPAQLSLLQPLLKFFMVKNDGTEKEIFFSDHMTEKQSLNLASLRRSNSAEELLTPNKQKGSNVGIKSFQWDYQNKHQGDRIIRANLELYFGSLAELVNVNYLQFLFTNGRESALYPNLSKGNEKDVFGRIQNITYQLDDLNAAIQKAQEGQSYLDLSAGANGSSPLFSKNDFLQLKVAVGWNVPKGSQQKLLRMFSGNADERRTKLADFLASVNRTQRIITLGLVDYEVNFSQEGPTTLSIKYMGSADSYLASIHSDVFGQFNSRLEMNNTNQVLDLSNNPELVKQIEKDAWYSGYIYHNFLRGTKDENDKPKDITVNYRDLLLEEKYLQLDLQRATLSGKQEHRIFETSRHLGVVEAILGLFLKKTEPERLAGLMTRLVRNKQVFTLLYEAGKKVTVTRGGLPYDSDWKNRIKKLFEEWAKGDKKEPPKLGDLWTKSPPGQRQIHYIRLGDLLKNACIQAELRDDIKFVLGTVDPTSIGQDTQAPIGIYDIPICIEYYMQFFYDRFVGQGRNSYPMRAFVDDLQAMLGRLVNQISGYQIQTSFGLTVYSSYNFIQEKILFPLTVDRYQKRNNNIIYKKAENGKIFHHYIFYANQIKPGERYGDKKKDEENGIYHYVLGSDRGLAREFNFSKIDMPQYKALQIEAANYGASRLERTVASSRALILPQNIEIVMFGNNLHQNGDYIYVDSRVALGQFANNVLSIGGYYKVVRSTHKITPGEFTTNLTCLYALPTGQRPDRPDSEE